MLVVNTQAPFVHGGAEYHADNLLASLRDAGHEADLVRIPFNWNPPRRILDQILAVRLLDITESFGQKVDLVIGLKFPAYCIKHPNKVLWILHQHRLAYEQWKPGAMGEDVAIGNNIRESIIRADNTYIPEARKVFANSRTVAERLQKFNGIDAEVLYHPPPHVDLLEPGAYGDYVFFPSRLAEIKRQHLAVEAMRHVKSGVRLVLAGPPESEEYAARLRSMVEAYRLEGQVEILGRISEEQKRALYAGALGVLYVPQDEDYGYVTLEGMHCAKAVITCEDSAGPLEFVSDRETGLVRPPDPKAVADAVDTLGADKPLAERMGRQGFDLMRDLGMSWAHVVEALTV